MLEMAAQQPTHDPKEIQLLGLLKDVQRLLDDALNSLGAKPLTPAPKYLAWEALHVNRAAKGYLLLRESGLAPASKLLVRPALEATIWGTAVIKEPGFLFRIPYTTLERESRPVAKNPALADLKLAASKASPSIPIECRPVHIREAAEVAKLPEAYDAVYGIYCKFTHGDMEAVQGLLDKATDPIDTDVIVWCVLTMLKQLLEHTPAQVPDLEPLWKNLKAIDGN